MPEIESSVAQLLEHYAAAAAAKDINSFMRLYDANVRVFDAWDQWVYDGATAWQAAVRAWFESLGTDSVRIAFDDVHSCVAGELAIVNAIVTYAGISAGGDVQRSMQNRITWAIRWSDSGARIIHEHTSAPIGFQDMKAILKR